MTAIQALILGIIQGLTEFLPISSSGHLIFVPKIFGWPDQGLAFDAIIHLGTLLAVVIYFRKKIKDIIFSKKGTSERRLGWLFIVSIIPASIIGLVFGDMIESNLRTPVFIAVSLVAWGVVLAIADWYSRGLDKKVDLKKVSWYQAVFIACAQALALMPGTSRSGITMTAGLFGKLSKKAAAEFSFLMSVPIIFLAGGLNVLELIQGGSETFSISSLIIGLLASAISGFFAIWGLLKIVEKWSFIPFAVYRVVVGLILLVIFAL